MGVGCRVRASPARERAPPGVMPVNRECPAMLLRPPHPLPVPPVPAAAKRASLPARAHRVARVPKPAASARRPVPVRLPPRAAHKAAVRVTLQASKADSRAVNRVGNPAARVERAPRGRSHQPRAAVRPVPQAVRRARGERLPSRDPGSRVVKAERGGTPRRAVHRRPAERAGSATTAVPQARRGTRAAGRVARLAVLPAVVRQAPAGPAADR